MVAADPMNSDDRPLLEFSCARSIPWQARLLQSLAMLSEFHSPVSGWVTNLPQPEINRAEMGRRFEASGHILRALVGQLARQPKVRRQQLDLALKCVPQHAHVKSCESELEQEIQDFRQVLKKDPGNITFSERLAEKLFLALQYNEAARLYEYVLRANPVPPQTAYLHLAQIQFAGGASSLAEQTLLQCLERWPTSAEAHDLLGGICLKTGRSAEARQHLEHALRLEPGNPLYKEHYAKATERR